ncbi:hypothetical protein yc1106_02805 [Curvularia clavata]|uniref:Rhodopsin domain-containing protein n=1 Tax=Curvularia clavata TaxID=95742 RepID=A0A9Q9DRL9_CURCL|nr:hypothetical protein yc1106_02805 [Curvularia clavata]
MALTRAPGLNIGYGRHLWDIRAVTLTHSRVLRFSQLSTLYIIGICFAKLSVLLMYLRFFEVVDFTRHLIYFGIFLTLFTSAAFIGHGIAQTVVCINVSAVTNKFCQAVSKVVIAQASVNVAMEFYILMIPLQQVYKLNMDSQRKLGLAAVFGIGLVACIASALRLGWSVRNLHEPDILWAAALISEMSIVEMNTAIIAPCLCLCICYYKAQHRRNVPPTIVTDEERTKSFIGRLLFWTTSHGRTLQDTEP